MTTITITAENGEDLKIISKMIKLLKLNGKISIKELITKDIERKTKSDIEKKRTIKKSRYEPNSTTIKAMNDVLAGKVTRVKNSDDFMKKLNS
jgi:hypothetical protein